MNFRTQPAASSSQTEATGVRSVRRSWSCGPAANARGPDHLQEGYATLLQAPGHGVVQELRRRPSRWWTRNSLSASDLYAKVFPSAPASTSEPVDEIEFEAVSRKLWQWAGTGIKSHCQETAEMEGLDCVLVEKKVFRASRDTSTGTGAPRAVMVRFFTSNPDLIFQLSSQPAAAKVVKAAEDAS